MSRRSPAQKRIMTEAKELAEPTDQYYAAPLEQQLAAVPLLMSSPYISSIVLFDFKGVVVGAILSDKSCCWAAPNILSGIRRGCGRYHGRIILPVEYPMKPPNIVMLTPNGRFEVGKKICLSFSAHHPESWQPAWGIRAMMLALIAFLPTKGEGAIAALDWTPEERKKCAESSKRWKCPDCGLLMSEALSETPTAVCLSAADKAAVAAMSAAGFAAPRSRTTSEASSAAAGAGGAATAGARSRTGSEALLETKEEETIAGAGAGAAAAGGSNNSGSLAAEAAKKLEAVVYKASKQKVGASEDGHADGADDDNTSADSILGKGGPTNRIFLSGPKRPKAPAGRTRSSIPARISTPPPGGDDDADGGAGEGAGDEPSLHETLLEQHRRKSNEQRRSFNVQHPRVKDPFAVLDSKNARGSGSSTSADMKFHSFGDFGKEMEEKRKSFNNESFSLIVPRPNAAAPKTNANKGSKARSRIKPGQHPSTFAKKAAALAPPTTLSVFQNAIASPAASPSGAMPPEPRELGPREAVRSAIFRQPPPPPPPPPQKAAPKQSQSQAQTQTLSDAIATLPAPPLNDGGTGTRSASSSDGYISVDGVSSMRATPPKSGDGGDGGDGAGDAAVPPRSMAQPATSTPPGESIKNNQHLPRHVRESLGLLDASNASPPPPPPYASPMAVAAGKLAMGAQLQILPPPGSSSSTRFQSPASKTKPSSSRKSVNFLPMGLGARRTSAVLTQAPPPPTRSINPYRKLSSQLSPTSMMQRPTFNKGRGLASPPPPTIKIDGSGDALAQTLSAAAAMPRARPSLGGGGTAELPAAAAAAAAQSSLPSLPIRTYTSDGDGEEVLGTGE
eukprot:gene19205-16842_t